MVTKHEATHGVALDAMAALEMEQPLGFDYRDVSMPVHVFHGRADNLVSEASAALLLLLLLLLFCCDCCSIYS